MSENITITDKDILEQVKLSCKIPEIIKDILNRKIIEDAAVKRDIKIEDEYLQKAADKFRIMHQLESPEHTWEWLQQHRLSLDDFESLSYHNALNAKLALHLFEDKIEPYFYDNQLNYAGVVMYEIVLDDEDLALELFYSIKEGEMSFYDAAHQYITNTELRRKGGYRGLLHRKDLKPEISAGVFAAQPPQLLKPILTSKGVHLIFVEEIIEPKLDNLLRHTIISDLLDEWLKQQMADIKIV